MVTGEHQGEVFLRAQNVAVGQGGRDPANPVWCGDGGCWHVMAIVYNLIMSDNC